MNELEKRAKHHSQKQSGLSPFCSMGEGVEVKNDTIIDFNFTKELMYDVEKHLRDNDDTKYLIDDLNILNDNTFGILINNGDWKHEHHYLEKVVGEYLRSLGLDFDHFTKQVGHSDSDCYSAYHYFEIKQSEPIKYDSDGDDEKAAEEAQYYANKLFTPVECRGITYYPKLELQEDNNELEESSYKSGDRYYGGLPSEPEYKGPGKSARYYKELVKYFNDTVAEYPEYQVLGSSPEVVVLRTPDGKELIDLCRYDSCADSEEAIEMASHYFDDSLFESKKKKNTLGGTLNPDAGNVEHNVAMFNKMNSPVDGPCNNPISGPFGGDVGCGEAMGEDMQKKSSTGVEFIEDSKSVNDDCTLTESQSNETVELYYDELFVEVVTRRGNPSGYYDRSLGGWLPDDDETEEIKISYEYEVDKEDIVTFIIESCMSEEDFSEYETATDEEVNEFVLSNFDDLYSKYEKKILDYYYDDAVDKAQEEYYDNGFYESVEEPTGCDNIDDEFDWEYN